MVDETIVLEPAPEPRPYVEKEFEFAGADILEVTPEPAGGPAAARQAEPALAPGAPPNASQALVPAAPRNLPRDKHVVFSTDDGSYAIPITHILEVGELGNFTPVPNVPDWVMGVTNLRGDIVSLIDFRALLGRPVEERRQNPRNLLLTQTIEGDITACLAVEQVVGLSSISDSQIQTIDTMASDKLTPYLFGVHTQGETLVSILNVEGLLRSLDLSYSQK
jgi:purine-binding chemotaxis protein CheW